MFKPIARWILKEELETYMKSAHDSLNNSIERAGQVYDLEEKVEELQAEVLDLKKDRVNSVDVRTFHDMKLTKEEQEFCDMLGKDPRLAVILEKLSMRLVAGVTYKQTPITEREVQAIREQKLAYSYLLETCAPEQPKENVNPLTGETDLNEQPR